MSWLRAAQRVSEMQSARVCARCGAAIVADNGWCDRCGLRRGAPAELSDALAATPLARAAGAPERTAGQTCASCGAQLDDRADWCRECGQTRIALFAAPATRAASNLRSEPTLSSHGLSRSAKAAIGASLLVAVAVVGSMAASYERTDTGGAASGPATTTLMGAAASGSGAVSGSAGMPSSISPSATSTGSQASAAPLPSIAVSGTLGPPTPAPTAAPTASQAAATPTPAPSAFAVDIASLPASMTPNTTVSVVVVTSPGASCTVKVKDHGGKLSLADGLKKKQVAGSSGIVSWTWTVDAATKKGNATFTVTCKLGKKSVSKSKVVLVL